MISAMSAPVSTLRWSIALLQAPFGPVSFVVSSLSPVGTSTGGGRVRRWKAIDFCGQTGGPVSRLFCFLRLSFLLVLHRRLGEVFVAVCRPGETDSPTWSGTREEIFTGSFCSRNLSPPRLAKPVHAAPERHTAVAHIRGPTLVFALESKRGDGSSSSWGAIRSSRFRRCLDGTEVC